MESLKDYEEHTLNNDIKSKKAYDYFKRIFDIVGSIIGIFILLPLFVLIGILIKTESDGPVIFKQIRVGINGKVFKMYKFRSMVKNAEELKHSLRKLNEMDGPMFKIKNDPRVTKVGSFIRRTSIDEIPQLINILKGDMSFVGPRPSLPEEVEQFEPWMIKRLCVKPGLTCFWQISRNSNITFEEWMKMDLKYIEERNLLIDLIMILKTFSVFWEK